MEYLRLLADRKVSLSWEEKRGYRPEDPDVDRCKKLREEGKQICSKWILPIKPQIKVRDTPFSPLNQVSVLQAAGRGLLCGCILPPSPKKSTEPAALLSGFAVQACCRQQ